MGKKSETLEDEVSATKFCYHRLQWINNLRATLCKIKDTLLEKKYMNGENFILRVTWFFAPNHKPPPCRIWCPYDFCNCHETTYDYVIRKSWIFIYYLFWFLYDNGLRHERVKPKWLYPLFSFALLIIILQFVIVEKFSSCFFVSWLIR